MIKNIELPNEIYFIGGSPCSGKSTLTKMAADKYHFTYFKIDDHLERYLKQGAGQNKPYCKHALSLSTDENWLRSPDVQNTEELGIYTEIFDFILEDLSKYPKHERIITEGAALLPSLIHQLGVPKTRYLSLVPTPRFQYEYYSKRPWVSYILADSSDPKIAFDNWMKRDMLFAEYVHAEAENLGYQTFINDGQTSIPDMFALLCKYMNWV